MIIIIWNIIIFCHWFLSFSKLVQIRDYLNINIKSKITTILVTHNWKNLDARFLFYLIFFHFFRIRGGINLNRNSTNYGFYKIAIYLQRALCNFIFKIQKLVRKIITDFFRVNEDFGLFTFVAVRSYNQISL